MKSSSFYSRKAEASRELGHWKIADEWAAKAAKARKIEKARKAKAAKSLPFVSIHDPRFPPMPHFVNLP